MTSAQNLDAHARAASLAAGLPPVLADARRLAATVALGDHGRRKPGRGDEFWQFRPAQPGDPRRMIDWRRSARSDQHFVQDKEWQSAQSVWLWVDQGRSMQFSSDAGKLRSKGHFATVLGLALAMLLIRAGERVGLAGAAPLPPASGNTQLAKITDALLAADPNAPDYGKPDFGAPAKGGNLVVISDFLEDPETLNAQMSIAGAKGISGTLLQVLDPQEQSFPFRGRIIFESMGQSIRHETRQAKSIRSLYQAKLAEHRAKLAALSARWQWPLKLTMTDQSQAAALLWLIQSVEHRTR